MKATLLRRLQYSFLLLSSCHRQQYRTTTTGVTAAIRATLLFASSFDWKSSAQRTTGHSRCHNPNYRRFAAAATILDQTRRAMTATANEDIKLTEKATSAWNPNDPVQKEEAKRLLDVWPLDEFNAALLDQVHPRGYTTSTNELHPVYDLIAIGAGAGGLVSSKQSARRGAKSAMISAHLAGGDCLNVGCVPSKALIRAAKAIREVRRSAEFGVVLPNGGSAADIGVDFATIVRRLRQCRTQISPADGHEGTTGTGAHVFQGRGIFTSPNTIKVVAVSSGDHGTNDNAREGIIVPELKFKTAVIATGGRPMIPRNIPGLAEAPYTTNEVLFNLETLPPRMVILGAGVVALEMAQSFATFGSHVTVLQRSNTLFESSFGDAEAAALLQQELEKSGTVRFLSGAVTKSVTTLRDNRSNDATEPFPLLRVTVATADDDGKEEDLECECLLVATGRAPNIENLGLEAANVEYKTGAGIVLNDKAQSVSNPNVYAVGDCVAGVPRLTHMSGEMAKLVVQNSLFSDNWKLSSLVVPSVMYTEPEYATVGIHSEAMAQNQNMAVDVYRGGMEHNDRAILDGTNIGFCKVICRRGTDEIVGATIVAERAGEMINEISLAIKNKIGLRAIGRNIHAYPTTGEAVMGAGIQYINANWKRLN